MPTIQIPLIQIKTDPNQPRKFKGLPEGLQQSIEQSGLINPITVTKEKEGYMIVCGELRFLSCKKLGWKMIEASIIPAMQPEKRFLMQISENLARGQMTSWETAEAVCKLIDSASARLKRNSSTDLHFSEVAKKLGRSVEFVSEQWDIIHAPKELAKAIKEEKVKATMIRVLSRTPDEFKKQLTEKILKGEFKSRENAFHVVQRMKERPDKVKELLAEDYSKLPAYQANFKAAQIAPTHRDEQWKDEDYFRRVEESATHLFNLINQNPFGIAKSGATLRIKFSRTCRHLVDLPRKINEFMSGFSKVKAIEQPIIEGELA